MYRYILSESCSQKFDPLLPLTPSLLATKAPVAAAAAVAPAPAPAVAAAAVSGVVGTPSRVIVLSNMVSLL